MREVSKSPRTMGQLGDLSRLSAAAIILSPGGNSNGVFLYPLEEVMYRQCSHFGRYSEIGFMRWISYFERAKQGGMMILAPKVMIANAPNKPRLKFAPIVPQNLQNRRCKAVLDKIIVVARLRARVGFAVNFEPDLSGSQPYLVDEFQDDSFAVVVHFREGEGFIQWDRAGPA